MINVNLRTAQLWFKDRTRQEEISILVSSQHLPAAPTPSSSKTSLRPHRPRRSFLKPKKAVKTQSAPVSATITPVLTTPPNDVMSPRQLNPRFSLSPSPLMNLAGSIIARKTFKITSIPRSKHSRETQLTPWILKFSFHLLFHFVSSIVSSATAEGGREDLRS